jgi:hypothetical protein
VFLVTGEHCFSQNGEVSWQEGVYRSRASALLAAMEAAAEHVDLRCLVDGDVYGAAWGCDAAGLSTATAAQLTLPTGM